MIMSSLNIHKIKTNIMINLLLSSLHPSYPVEVVGIDETTRKVEKNKVEDDLQKKSFSIQSTSQNSVMMKQQCCSTTLKYIISITYHPISFYSCRVRSKITTLD